MCDATKTCVSTYSNVSNHMTRDMLSVGCHQNICINVLQCKQLCDMQSCDGTKTFVLTCSNASKHVTCNYEHVVVSPHFSLDWSQFLVVLTFRLFMVRLHLCTMQFVYHAICVLCDLCTTQSVYCAICVVCNVCVPRNLCTSQVSAQLRSRKPPVCCRYLLLC